MASRARLVIATSLLAIPCIAWPDACRAHNGRDVGDAELADAHRPAARTPHGVLIDIFDGIRVSVDPRTGVRTYTQVGDVPANPGLAEATVTEPSVGPGVAYWVEKSFAGNDAPGYAPSAMIAPEPQVSVYDEGYPVYGFGYGGYLGYGYGHGGGGGHHRPRHDDPRHDHPIHDHASSPPPGPYGGGVGSPPPYYDAGVGAPVPLRYNSFRGRRG